MVSLDREKTSCGTSLLTEDVPMFPGRSNGVIPCYDLPVGVLNRCPDEPGNRRERDTSQTEERKERMSKQRTLVRGFLEDVCQEVEFQTKVP